MAITNRSVYSFAQSQSASVSVYTLIGGMNRATNSQMSPSESVASSETSETQSVSDDLSSSVSYVLYIKRTAPNILI